MGEDANTPMTSRASCHATPRHTGHARCRRVAPCRASPGRHIAYSTRHPVDMNPHIHTHTSTHTHTHTHTHMRARMLLVLVLQA